MSYKLFLNNEVNILQIMLREEFNSRSESIEQKEMEDGVPYLKHLGQLLHNLEEHLERRYYYVHVNNHNGRIYEFYFFNNSHLLEIVCKIKYTIRELSQSQPQHKTLQELRHTLKRICSNSHFNDPIFKKDTFTCYKTVKLYAMYKKAKMYATMFKAINYAVYETIYRKLFR